MGTILSLDPNHPLINLLSKLTILGAHKQGWRALSRLGAPLRPLLYSPGHSAVHTRPGISLLRHQTGEVAPEERDSLTSSTRRGSFRQDACTNGEGLSFLLNSYLSWLS